jgi:8-oxo-dGTP pyrophosphatase MutT (NUDIX family)
MNQQAPQVPVPVVRLIVSDDAGRVLVLKRCAGGYGGGQWCLPGGKIDYGDGIEETAAKELMEETSLTCLEPGFLFVQNSLPPSPGGMHCINLYYRCKHSGQVALDEESTDYAWIGREDMARYDIAFRNDEGLKRYWGDG